MRDEPGTRAVAAEQAGCTTGDKGTGAVRTVDGGAAELAVAAAADTPTAADDNAVDDDTDGVWPIWKADVYAFRRETAARVIAAHRASHARVLSGTDSCACRW